MKVLTTGCAGFIGSHLCDRLLKDGHEVVGIDKLSTGKMENLPVHERFTFIRGDVREFNTCLFSRSTLEGIEAVFHVSAQARIQPTVTNPRLSHNNNIDGTFELLEFMRLHGVKKIVFSSSSSIYGKNPIPFKEGMPNDCLNPYSMSKFVCEEMIKTYCKLYGIQGISLRYFNVWGPREYIDGEWGTVIGKFFRQVLLEKVPLTIVGDGQQRRDFTYIDDVVDANIKAMDVLGDVNFAYPGVIFNIGTGKSHSLSEIATKIILHCGCGKIKYIPARPAESYETLADISAAKFWLNWEPKVSLEDRIDQHRDYYKQKWNIK